MNRKGKNESTQSEDIPPGTRAAADWGQPQSRGFFRAAIDDITTAQPLTLRVSEPLPDSHPIRQSSLLLQTVIVRGEKTDEGHLIEAVTVPWFSIVAELVKNPKVAFELSSDKWEELLAGAYKAAGFDEVTLTPRSGDRGRDVIAVKRALGTVRVIDQMKAYAPRRLVTANDVRALVGVLVSDGAAKGFVTTTSNFAPKIASDPLMSPWIPSRLELINGQQLLTKLSEIAKRQK